MTPVVHLRNGIAGYFRLRKGKVDEDGVPIPGTEREVAAFRNLITDNGMDKVWSAPTIFMYPSCVVGTGSTAPAFTDTELDVYLAITGADVANETPTFVDHVTDPYWRLIRSYRFDAGTATGNLTEVGTGWTATNLFSRALILDGGGSPTTITVLADEYLDVTYECRNYIDISDQVGVMTISGTPYDVTWRPALIGTTPNIHRTMSTTTMQMELAQTQVLGTIYSAPASRTDADTGTSATYVSGNYYNDFTFDWGLTLGNFGAGIGSGMIEVSQARYQIQFDPPLPKTASMVLSLTFRVSWARYP